MGNQSTFTILMTGLCAFVPREDIEKSPKNNQVRVLLVESTSDMDLPNSGMNYLHEQHVPVLIVPCVNISGASGDREPDLVFWKSKDKQWALFYLEGQDLRIEGAQSQRLEIDVKYGAGIGCPDYSTNGKAFEWVADFASVSPGSEYVDEACLSDEGDPAVAARVELWEGKISTNRLGLDEIDNYPVLWTYRVPDSPRRGPSHYQAAADIVEFETYFDKSVTLLTSRFGYRNNPSRIGLSIPATGEANNGIQIWVKNMPWADILGARVPEGYRNKPDIHFAHLYKVCLDYDFANVPHFYRYCSTPDTGPHAGNPNCQPVRTAPNPKA